MYSLSSVMHNGNTYVVTAKIKNKKESVALANLRAGLIKKNACKLRLILDLRVG